MHEKISSYHMEAWYVYFGNLRFYTTIIYEFAKYLNIAFE